jgi:Flp pilus assembly protein protease CpaA
MNTTQLVGVIGCLVSVLVLFAGVPAEAPELVVVGLVGLLGSLLVFAAGRMTEGGTK